MQLPALAGAALPGWSSGRPIVGLTVRMQSGSSTTTLAPALVSLWPVPRKRGLSLFALCLHSTLSRWSPGPRSVGPGSKQAPPITRGMKNADDRHAVRPRKVEHQVVLEAAYAPFAHVPQSRIAEVERSANSRLLCQICEGRAGIGQEAIGGLLAGGFRQVDKVLDQISETGTDHDFFQTRQKRRQKRGRNGRNGDRPRFFQTKLARPFRVAIISGKARGQVLIFDFRPRQE